MIDNSDVEAALAKGIISHDAALGIRNLAAERRAAPLADEEQFGSVVGLSDVMTSVGLVLLLGSAMLVTPMTALLLAPASWLFAEYVTRTRRLVLSSFILFGMFVISWSLICLAIAIVVPASHPLGPNTLPRSPLDLTPLRGVIIAFGTSMGCLLWWVRFRLPIAIAGMVMAGANVIVHLARMVAPESSAFCVSVMLVLIGIGMFVLAMAWDMSDVRRETARSDVAFWLHAMAGYQIACATYRLLFGVVGNPHGWGRLYAFAAQMPETWPAIVGLIVFVIFSWIALVVNRRSLIMSSIAFIAPALAQMMRQTGHAGPLFAAMLLGGFMLLLSVNWFKLRELALRKVPIYVRAQVPRVALTNTGVRPVL